MPRLFVVVGLALTAALVTGVAAPQLAGVDGGGPPVLTGAAAVTTLTSYGLRGSHVVGYQEGASLVVGLPVRNKGRLPVTVTSARLRSQSYPLLEPRLSEPLPLRLRAGAVRSLTLHTRLANCARYHEREVQVYDAVELTYRVLGRARTARIALDRPIVVRSPTIVGCPDRKLNRDAVNRG